MPAVAQTAEHAGASPYHTVYMMGKSHILVECDTQVNDSGGTGNIGIHEFDVDRRETLNVLSRAKNGKQLSRRLSRPVYIRGAFNK